MPQLNVGRYQRPVLLEGKYTGTLVRVTDYTRTYKDGPVTKLAWIFEVDASQDDIDPDIDYAVEFAGKVEVVASTYEAVGPNSKFAKMGFDSIKPEGWKGHTDEMLGTQATLIVDTYQKNNGEWANGVERVSPVGGKTKKSKAQERAAAEEAADFADIEL